MTRKQGEIREPRQATFAIVVLGAIGFVVMRMFSGSPPDSTPAPVPAAAATERPPLAPATHTTGWAITGASWTTAAAGSDAAPDAGDDDLLSLNPEWVGLPPTEIQRRLRLLEEARERWQNTDIAIQKQ